VKKETEKEYKCSTALMVGGLGELEEKFAELEQAIYLNRLEEAEQLITELSSIADLTVAQATGLAFAEAELSYWRVYYDEAEEHFKAALYNSERRLKDPFCIARAYYGLGRVERKRGHHDRAIDLLETARQRLKGLTETKAQFLDALIRFNLGVLNQKIGLMAQSEELLKKAVEDLQSIEGGRFYGLTLNSLGIVTMLLGKYQEALSLFLKATDIFSEQAILEDLAWSRYNTAFVLTCLKRHKEAKSILLDCLELDRRLGDPVREARSLELLAEIALALKAPDEAVQLSRQAVELAELSRNDYAIAGALLVWGRSLATLDRTKAIEVLNRAMELAEAHDEKREMIGANIYLAEVMLGMNRVKTGQYLSAAEKLLAQCPDKYLESQARAIKKKLEQNPVEVSDDTFLIHKNRLPTWRTAKRSLEVFLLKSALEQTNYSGNETAKLLKISKATVSEKRDLYKI